MNKLKQKLARLFRWKDYKMINSLLRCNPNTWSFDTKEINEEISCKEKILLNEKVY